MGLSGVCWDASAYEGSDGISLCPRGLISGAAVVDGPSPRLYFGNEVRVGDQGIGEPVPTRVDTEDFKVCLVKEPFHYLGVNWGLVNQAGVLAVNKQLIGVADRNGICRGGLIQVFQGMKFDD